METPQGAFVNRLLFLIPLKNDALDVNLKLLFVAKIRIICEVLVIFAGANLSVTRRLGSSAEDCGGKVEKKFLRKLFFGCPVLQPVFMPIFRV